MQFIAPTNFNRFGRFNGGAGGGSSAPSASFSATLLSSLIPEVFTGSSTPTFTRATTAYVSDFEGLLKQVPSGASRHTGARFVRNFVRGSESTTGWLLNTVTATAGKTDPLGGTTAFRLTATAASNNVLYDDRTWPSGAQSSTATWSAWIKRVTGTGNVRLAMRGGAVTATLTLTTSWQRFSITGVGGVSGTCQFNIYIDTNGDEIDVWGMQGEEVVGQSNQNPSEYVSVGVLSAPYHGAGVDGCKYFTTENGNTVSSNVVTEATGTAISSATLLGYQAEGARTNFITYSEDFTNAAWSKTDVTVTGNTIAGPAGTTTADTVTEAAANNIHILLNSSSATAAGNVVASVFVKKGTRRYAGVQAAVDGGGKRFSALFDLDTGLFVTSNSTGSPTGTGYGIAAVGSSGWYRIYATCVSGGAGADDCIPFLSDSASPSWASSFPVYLGAITEYNYFFGAQIEDGAFPSSYIPTTTVAVTRNKDALSYASASNIDATVGTMYAEAQIAASTGSNIIIGGGAFATRFYTGAATSVTANDGAVNTSTTGSGTSYLTAPRKAAMNWGGATMAISKDGAAAVSGSFDGNLGVTSITVGDAGASYELFGTVRNIAIYTTKKTDAELQALTT